MTLSGNFDWTEANAAASWGLGNDGVVAPADNYCSRRPANVNNVTITAVTRARQRLGVPAIKPTDNLEGVFVLQW